MSWEYKRNPGYLPGMGGRLGYVHFPPALETEPELPIGGITGEVILFGLQVKCVFWSLFCLVFHHVL